MMMLMMIDDQVILTGHSLGGAIAKVLAAKL